MMLQLVPQTLHPSQVTFSLTEGHLLVMFITAQSQFLDNPTLFHKDTHKLKALQLVLSVACHLVAVVAYLHPIYPYFSLNNLFLLAWGIQCPHILVPWMVPCYLRWMTWVWKLKSLVISFCIHIAVGIIK